jgi:NAD(P)-dependent dehydrogenase (short-subunit alcohol dehydrogenase family)
MQMPGRVAGKVAFITGAGRGQGRSHAIRLAEEGADIIAADVLEDYPTVRYEMSSQADLDETVRAVEALGRKIVAAKADVRDTATLRAPWTPAWHSWDQVTPQVWQDTIDTNLTGVWNTIVVAVPHLIAAGGGSIIATSSTAGLKGMPFLPPTWRPSTPWSASAGRWPTSSPAITSGSTPCTQPGSIPRWSTDSRPSSRS